MCLYTYNYDTYNYTHFKILINIWQVIYCEWLAKAHILKYTGLAVSINYVVINCYKIFTTIVLVEYNINIWTLWSSEKGWQAAYSINVWI